MTEHNRRLLAHLMRRAGFGATSSELDELSEISYEDVVDNLLDPLDESWMGEHLIRRFHHEQSGKMSAFGPSEYWLYQMVTTKAPLIEKMTLFWHGILMVLISLVSYASKRPQQTTSHGIYIVFSLGMRSPFPLGMKLRQ